MVEHGTFNVKRTSPGFLANPLGTTEKSRRTQLCPAHFMRCRDVYVEFLFRFHFCCGLARHQLYYLMRA
jgi:hypothetical protein